MRLQGVQAGKRMTYINSEFPLVPLGHLHSSPFSSAYYESVNLTGMAIG